jgi:hypothetical protein
LSQVDHERSIAVHRDDREHRLGAILDATDAAVQRAGREVTEDELIALWCEHSR